ncbi:baseplate J/gp47 family protein [Paenibacillus sp. 481]|uniref:baseplate J/gp47 family protein n=1 Tax=Paenibacillus sp. 481 TaxID=2835869 RepID=UPI001E3EFE6E|nr:baseplate J/gp47 family protein [Paenibacillus sp. 481]UHA73461.1 baseplate J/gp47 family protein [Paenibacillus sp. 481]
MLPLPNLDDRDFEQIVKNAKQLIPKLSPNWTDENVHDPGITLIELLAWLTEMQQYFLNRVTVKNELKFLKLLGIRREDAAFAKVDVTFNQVTTETVVPKGTKLEAGGESFETDETILLVPNGISKVLVRSDTEQVDRTSANAYIGAAFYVFGPKAEAGSKLYLGFDSPLPIGKSLALTVHLYEDYPISLGSATGNDNGKRSCHYPTVQLSCTYFGSSLDAQEVVANWQPLEILVDETCQFTCSGRITFRIPSEMHPITMYPTNDRARYWICFTVVEDGYEVAPQMLNMCLNTVAASHYDTLSSELLIDGTSKPGQMFTVDDYLSYYGKVEVQVRQADGGWMDWQCTDSLSLLGPMEQGFTLLRNPETKETVVEFGDGIHGAMPPDGRQTIRLISYAPAFEQERWIGDSRGLPEQVYPLYKDNLLPEFFRLQVGERHDGYEELIWYDWTRVDDFDHSSSYDRHYVLDHEKGELLFGDHEQGMIPEASERSNIRIIASKVGGGQRGNIKSNSVFTHNERHEMNGISGSSTELLSLTGNNRFHGTGGVERETIEDAKGKITLALKKRHSAVTNEDFEEIVKSTPGLRVARSKALPLYKPGLKDYPARKSPTHMSVVVIPYSDALKPMPSQAFLQAIKAYIEPYRLLTTQVHIIAPVYVEITVQAVVAVEPNGKDVDLTILDVLNSHLQPLDLKDGTKGWTFGCTVHKGDIYGIIQTVKGVAFIQDLSIHAKGKEIHKAASGDIHIPPHGLVYPGNHVITTIKSPQQ